MQKAGAVGQGNVGGRGRDVRGCVETLGPEAITGWAHSRSGAQLSLALRLADAAFQLNFQKQERKDVAASYGAAFEHAGFRVTVPETLRERISAALAAGEPIAFFANGSPLDNLWKRSSAPLRAQSGRSPSAGVPAAAKTTPPLGFVDGFKPFSIVGWATPGAGPLQLVCNGAPIETIVTRNDREDVATTLGINAAKTGFVLDLPATLWESVLPGEPCKVQVMCGETVLPPGPVSIDRKRVAEWTADLMRWHDMAEKRYLLRLALGHLERGRMLEMLDAATLHGLSAFARKEKAGLHMFASIPTLPTEAAIPAPKEAAKRATGAASEAGKVDEQLTGELEPETSAPDAPPPRESLDTLLLWDAMRDLNHRLELERGPALAEIAAVSGSRPLSATARDWLMNLAAQVTCETGEFEQLRAFTDFGRLRELATSPDLHAVSLSVPALVSERAIAKAVAALGRIASSATPTVWLHTHCLRHALRELLRLERAGEIDPSSADRFRNAYIAVLDAQASDWFHRLHDLAFVESMIDMIEAFGQLSDAQRAKISAAAVRLYGLSPAFWQRLNARMGNSLPGLLSAARRHWDICCAFIDGFDRRAQPTRDFAESLDWFVRQGAVDAPVAMREIVMNCLSRDEPDSGASCSPLAATMLLAWPADAIRLAAFPLPSDALVAGVVEQKPLIECVREASGIAGAPMAALERETVAAFMALRESAQRKDPTAQDRLCALFERATLLSAPGSGLLGLDLLAAAYCLGVGGDRAAKGALIALRELQKKAISGAAAGVELGAPLYTALARLRMLPDDPFAAAIADEIHGLLDAMAPFSAASDPPGALYPAFTKGEPAAIAADWLSDTLVMVELAGANGDATQRAAEIRTSWGASLGAAGVRCLYVREAAETGLEGDMLSIVPADGPSGSQQDLIRLFQWAHANTAALFVLIIPQDCTVTASRLLESVAWRKHHYWGRVLDQAPAGSLPAPQDILGTSMRRMRYADRSFGLSLSRYAIGRLMAASRSIHGQRVAQRVPEPDRLVGALLALANIPPSDEGFHCHGERLFFAGALPVAERDNLFVPGPASPTVIAKLDLSRRTQPQAEASSTMRLAPAKIWPTTGAPSLGRNANQLQLISEPGRLSNLRAGPITVIGVVRNEMVMLPHFLAHYRRMGVASFVFVDNCSDDGTREYLAAQADTVVYSTDTEYRQSHYGVTWQHAVMANHCLDRWVLLADADEFLVYEDCETAPLAGFIAKLEAEGGGAPLVRMIDMYPYGDLADADFSKAEPFAAAPWFDREPLIELMFGGGQFSNSRNFVNGLRHRIAPSRINAYVSQKYPLFRYKPWVRISEGVHYTANMPPSRQAAFFAHFKYHAGFKQKVATEVERNQHFNGAEEYRRYAAMLKEGSGAFGDERLSVRYRSSASFLELDGHRKLP